MSYVREKLYQATLSLVGSRPLDQRLQDAAIILLRLRHDMHMKDDEFKQRFEAMMDKLTAPVDDAADGYIAANIARMSNEEMGEIADEIVGMLWQDGQW